MYNFPFLPLSGLLLCGCGTGCSSVSNMQLFVRAQELHTLEAPVASLEGIAPDQVMPLAGILPGDEATLG